MKKEICDFLKVGQNIPIKLGDAVSLVYPYITLAICSFTCPNSSFPSMFLGFSIYVSNTTDKLKGTLCYKDTEFNTSTIPSVVNTTCLVHGQYVISYNDSQQLYTLDIRNTRGMRFVNLKYLTSSKNIFFF